MKRLTWGKTEPPEFSHVPEKPGIYIISTRQEADHEFEAKYVGQADNLHVRAKEHWSKKEKNKELKDHIAEKYVMKFNYSIVDSKAERDGMESYLCRILDPSFNHNSAPGKEEIICSLPAVRKHS